MYAGRPRTSPASETGWAKTPFTRRQFLKTVTVSAGVVLTGQAALRAAAAQDKITLTQWYHQYGEEGTQDAALRYAQEYTTVNPNVQVKMTWVAGDYGAKLSSALLTPEGPDVYEDALTVAKVKAGQVAPLDDLFTEEVKKDFNPKDLETSTVDGKIYGVKMIDDMGLLYYRKSLLEKAEVKPPTTMDEVIAAAKKLSGGRTKGLFLGNDGGITALLNIAPWSAGSDFLVDNKIVFNNEKTVAAYEKVRELSTSGGVLTGAPTDWWDPSAFTQNLVAMQWTGLWAMPGIKKGIGDDFGVVPWPTLGAGGTPATFWGGWTEFVNGKSKNIDAAKQFVKWLWIENTKNQQDWSLSYGFHIPPRLSAAAAAEPLKTGPAKEAVDFLAKYGRVTPPAWTGAMGTILTDALTKIVKNNADAKQEVAAAAQKCEAELKQVLA